MKYKIKINHYFIFILSPHIFEVCPLLMNTMMVFTSQQEAHRP